MTCKDTGSFCSWTPPEFQPPAKFRPEEVARITLTPTWAVSRTIEHPQWQALRSGSDEQHSPTLSIDQAFCLTIFGQLMAFGLTADQASTAMSILEAGFTVPGSSVPETAGSMYRGMPWLPDRHLIVRNWHSCGVAHTCQLGEQQNVPWYELGSGRRTTSMLYLCASTVQIPISDIFILLTRVLPEGLRF